MARNLDLGRGERAVLWAVAAAGAVVLNGVFLYGVFVRPDLHAAAVANPVALVFMVEALLLVALFAWLLAKWQVSRIHWLGFVALAIVGGLAFAVPLALLFPRPPGDGEAAR